MGNTLDYLAWRGDLPFSSSPFCEVDSLIFSQLAYLPMDGLVPSDKSRDGVSLPEVMKQLTEGTA